MSDTSNGHDKPRPPSKADLPVRFYQAVSVSRGENGYRILLDERPIKSPNRMILEVPTAALGEAIRDEWAAQGLHIDPETMPLTKLVNTALDGGVGNESALVETIAPFITSDLVSYRAEAPDELVALQAKAWDPLMHWARDALGIGMVTTTGVMPVAQPDGTLQRATEVLSSHSALELCALHTLTTLTGSLVVALALERGHIEPADAWMAAHVDEDYQIGQWGADDEARARRAYRRSQFDSAYRLLLLLG